MLKKIKFKIGNQISINDKISIETEIEVLAGIKDIIVDNQTGISEIEFDDQKISQKKILQTLANLGYQEIYQPIQGQAMVQEHTYFVRGMHCASCEILIEKKLLKINGIKSVEASTAKGEVFIEYSGRRPSGNELNQILKNNGYTFFEQPLKNEIAAGGNNIFKSLVIAGIIIIIFILLNRFGVSSWINVNSSSALPAFFLLGLMAGLSSCAALVGGMVLSMSKQWLSLYQTNDSTWQKLQPHLMFNAGRLISYGLLGAVLGAIGSKLQVSFTFTAVLVMIISILMLFLGMQMLGFKAFRKFQLTMPKFITRRVADESKFQGRRMPFTMGALTFFLPCGFTITAQGLALLSGNVLQGGLIMFLFALGTAPMLLAIGLSSIKFSSRPHLANKFLKVAGVVVLFFALFNINSQLNVLGVPSFSDVFTKSKANSNSSVTTNNFDANESDLPEIINGKQVIKMAASASGYNPNYFKVRTGVPVRWEITDTGTSGCTNAVLSRSLFDGQIELTPGTTSVKEFTPQSPGKYKFSCWMGMISGIIEVVDTNNSPNSVSAASVNNNGTAAAIIPSGAQGCGCGGGGGSSCSASR